MIQDKLETFKKKDIYGKTNFLAFCFLCLFLLDCCITGGGRYLSIFGLSVRMIWGILCILFSIPTLLKNWKQHVKNPIHLMFLAFLIWFAICAVRGIKAGNNQAVLMTDIKGFMYLFLIPISMNCITSKKRIHKILDVVVLGALIQSIIIIVLQILFAIDVSYLVTMHDYVRDIQLGTVSVITESIFRIFMNSEPYLIVACVILFFRQLHREKWSIRYTLLTTLYINALLLSFTRSLYGSVGISIIVSVVLAIVLHPQKFKMMVKYIIAVGLCTLMLVVSEEIVFEASLINFAIARTFNTTAELSFTSTLLDRIQGDESGGDKAEGTAMESYLDETAESDNRRAITKRELRELIKKNPILGNGLGACSQTRNAADEYFYLDILARMGVIGLALYMLPFVYMLLQTKKEKKAAEMCCTLVPFWVATIFNPWMNAVLGIMWYANTAASVNELASPGIRRENE